MRPLNVSSVALILATLSGACAPTANDSLSSRIPEGGASSEVSKPVKVDPNHPAATKTESAAFAASTNALAMDLYSQLGKAGNNLAFSPASIETAFAMTWAGAKGQTAAEMQKVLHLDADRQTALDGAADVVIGYQKEHTGYDLSFADKLYGDGSYPFDPGFIALSKDTFGAPLEVVDFQHSPDPSRLKINAFVSATTKGKITDLLPEGAIMPSTSLVLVNAVYMHAAWQHPFDASETSEGPFDHQGTKTMVPTMHEETQAGYADTDGAQVLDMPYAGGDLAMTVILPKDKNDLSAVEGSLMSKGGFDHFVGATQPTDVRVALPKFKIGEGASVALKSTMSGLGMSLAFDASKADFSGMSNGGRPLHISDAFHKAFVAVGETGTEAAAATAVVVGIRAAMVPAPSKAVVFDADHPFVFAIRDVHTNLILFMGRVSNPEA